jgi:hypothetical protein
MTTTQRRNRTRKENAKKKRMKHRRRTAWEIELLLMSIPDHPPEIQVSIREFSPTAKMGICCQRAMLPLWQQMPFLTHFHLLSFNYCAVLALETHRHSRPRLGHRREPLIMCLCL